jgi:twitching motility two-component system response regulator PilH
MPINRVLIVEDDQAQLVHLQNLLASAGYAVTVAHDGQEGLAKAKSDNPQVILMDINMPVMDGFAAARSLRSDPATKDIPVIFVSAKDQKADRVWATMNGAKGYVTKPYHPDQILDQIKTLG